MLVANMKQCTMIRARQEEECKNSVRFPKNMNERHGKLLAKMERKQNLMSKAPEDLRKKMFQEVRDLDEKISGEEIGLLEKNQILDKKQIQRRSAETDEGRDPVVAGSGVTRRAVAGSRSFEREGDLRLADVVSG